MKLLLIFFFASSASAATQLNIEAQGVQPRQLISLRGGELQCTHSKIEVQAGFQITNAFIDEDDRPQFTAELDLKIRSGKNEWTHLHGKNQSLTWILSGDVDAANRAYRADLNLPAARRAFFNHQLQRFLLTADNLRIEVNMGAEKVFSLSPQMDPEITLEGSEIFVEAVENETILASGLSMCHLTIRF